MNERATSSAGERAAQGLVVGVVAGIAAGALAALRPGGPSWTEGLALGAAASVVTAPLAAGLRALGAPSGCGWAPLDALWVAAAPLGVFAELLAAKTHHRPLGATTFAILGALSVGAAVVVTARLHAGGRLARVAVWAARALGALGVAWLVLRLGASGAARAGLVDATTLLVLGVLAARAPGWLPRVPLVAAATAALAVGLGGRLLAATAIGLGALERAPVLGWIAGVR